MKIYNTLTRKIEEFKPIKPGFVGMYTCGMTVYDHTHLGHMRTYTNTDFLRRVLEYNGFKVRHVENVTDVGHLTSDADTGEDKMEKRARERKENIWEIAERFAEEFYDTTGALNVSRPHVICKATDHIEEMISLVKRLEEKGFTYVIPSEGVYFDTSKLSDYGKLARLDIKGLRAGARVEKVEGKRNIIDFALWKFTPEGERRQMEWESPWAKRSFPGWHIECSAMSMRYLGETFDIHTGGVDHIPVHHTNEIAQSEAATGKTFVNYWFHNEFLMIEGQKMSKSLGNLYWMRDIKERGFEPLALRYLFLTAHYRTRMNFTWKALEGAQSAFNRLRRIVGEWGESKIGCAKYEEKFLEEINNDLDMPRALALTWELIKSDYPSSAKKATILKFDEVLGLRLGEAMEKKISEEIERRIKRREKLRKEGKFAEADRVRDQILKLGYEIEDTPEGPKVKPSSWNWESNWESKELDKL